MIFARTSKTILSYSSTRQKKRNVGCLIKLPGYKTEYVMKSFRFMGAKICNNLPIDFRKTDSFKQFEEMLKKHFFKKSVIFGTCT